MGYSESFREQAGGQAADFADEHCERMANGWEA
jgi:hypothetical protein